MKVGSRTVTTNPKKDDMSFIVYDNVWLLEKDDKACDNNTEINVVGGTEELFLRLETESFDIKYVDGKASVCLCKNLSVDQAISLATALAKYAQNVGKIKAEEKETWDIWSVTFNGLGDDYKSVIREIQRRHNKPLHEVMDMVNFLPFVYKDRLTASEAKDIAYVFEQLGADVEIKST